jgi:hypothetical protein
MSASEKGVMRRSIHFGMGLGRHGKLWRYRLGVVIRTLHFLRTQDKGNGDGDTYRVRDKADRAAFRHFHYFRDRRIFQASVEQPAPAPDRMKFVLDINEAAENVIDNDLLVVEAQGHRKRQFGCKPSTR